MKLNKQYFDHELQAFDVVDYMAISHELFEELSAKEIYNNAAEFWQNKKNAKLIESNYGTAV
jgi:hypothetical protein